MNANSSTCRPHVLTTYSEPPKVTSYRIKMGAVGMGIKRKQAWVWVLLATAWAQTALTAPALNHASPEKAVRQYSESREPCTRYDENRQAFFGDLHVHTRYSLDASTQGTQTTPDQAYRFALPVFICSRYRGINDFIIVTKCR